MSFNGYVCNIVNNKKIDIMRKYFIVLVVFLAGVLSASAQTKDNLPSAEDRAQMQTEFMTEKLNLSKDQVPKVLKINIDSAKKMDLVINMTDKMKKFKEFRSIILKKDKSLKEVLSKEQFKKYLKSKDELKKIIKKKRKEKK